MALGDLLRFKYPLAKAVQQKVAAYRQQAYAQGYQTFLLDAGAEVATSFADGFAFDERPYPAAWFYRGAYRFGKHFFGSVGELESKGEEFECARLLDTLPQVKHWIRNLAGRPQTSFWLPTSIDRFYPDFVAMLQDGRLFALEYKGGHLADSGDTKEKANIGQLWADRSGGTGVFLMAQKQDAQDRSLGEQIAEAIR
jgi:type III restriction enzyme